MIPQKPPHVAYKEVTFEDVSLTVFAFNKRLTARAMLGASLRLPTELTIGEVATLLKERRHLLSISQLDRMIEMQDKFYRRQDGGSDLGLRTDAYANLILVEHSGVVAMNVGLRVWGWRRYPTALDSITPWYQEALLVLCNASPIR